MKRCSRTAPTPPCVRDPLRRATGTSHSWSSRELGARPAGALLAFRLARGARVARSSAPGVSPRRARRGGEGSIPGDRAGGRVRSASARHPRRRRSAASVPASTSRSYEREISAMLALELDYRHEAGAPARVRRALRKLGRRRGPGDRRAARDPTGSGHELGRRSALRRRSRLGARGARRRRDDTDPPLPRERARVRGGALRPPRRATTASPAETAPDRSSRCSTSAPSRRYRAISCADSRALLRLALEEGERADPDGGTRGLRGDRLRPRAARAPEAPPPASVGEPARTAVCRKNSATRSRAALPCASSSASTANSSASRARRSSSSWCVPTRGSWPTCARSARPFRRAASRSSSPADSTEPSSAAR